jgi:hypothetical protein
MRSPEQEGAREYEHLEGFAVQLPIWKSSTRRTQLHMFTCYELQRIPQDGLSYITELGIALPCRDSHGQHDRRHL